LWQSIARVKPLVLFAAQNRSRVTARIYECFEISPIKERLCSSMPGLAAGDAGMISVIAGSSLTGFRGSLPRLHAGPLAWMTLSGSLVIARAAAHPKD
jgi:hypothetical protein